MQPLFEHRLRVDGFRTRALELEGTGPGLVLLHGFGDSADTWRPLLEILGRRGQRALAVDLPGFGAASPVGPGALLPQWDAFAGDLVEQVAADARREVFVAGNSLGGSVALRLAERADLPLGGVMPIAPAGLDMPGWLGIIERDPLVRKVLALPLPIPRRVLADAVGQVYRRLAFARPGDADPRVVAGFAAHHPDRAAVGRLLAVGRRLYPEISAVAGCFELERVRCPATVIWGTRDRMVPHAGARIVQEAVPHAEVVLLEGCGHCPQLEAAPRVADLLRRFLAQGDWQDAATSQVASDRCAPPS